MKTLQLIPGSASYAATDEPEIIHNPLDGGRGRFRRDWIKVSRTVNVQFSMDPLKFEYLCCFYRYAMRNASQPFEAQLVIDESALTVHECHFVPDTFKLVQQEGLLYVVAAQFEITPLDYDAGDDETAIDAYVPA